MFNWGDGEYEKEHEDAAAQEPHDDVADEEELGGVWDGEEVEHEGIAWLERSIAALERRARRESAREWRERNRREMEAAAEPLTPEELERFARGKPSPAEIATRLLHTLFDVDVPARPEEAVALFVDLGGPAAREILGLPPEETPRP